MHFIELMYLAASFVSIFALLPQIKRLFVAKESDELSLATWIIWTGYQVIAFMYSLSVHLVMYSIVNASWIFFYTIMLVLIIKYRVKKPLTAVPQLQVQENDSSE